MLPHEIAARFAGAGVDAAAARRIFASVVGRFRGDLAGVRGVRRAALERIARETYLDAPEIVERRAAADGFSKCPASHRWRNPRSTARDRQAKDRTAVYNMMLQAGNANDYTLRQLAQFGPDAAATVPAVIPVLKHERPLYRYLAAEVLGAIGPGAGEAVPALTAALQDDDAVVRESAAGALRAIETGRATDAPHGIEAPK